MEKRSLRTSNWLQAACLLVVLLLGGLSAQANITQELALGELVSGTAYDVPANTHVTATFTAPSNGTVTLTSTVDANTNLVPYVDADYSDPIESVRDEEAKSKTFDVVGGTTYYFQQTTNTTPFSVTLTFVETVVPEITATWSIEEGTELESFESVSVTFAGVDSAKSYSMYPAVFYSVAEDGTTALVENYCTAGVLDASASGTTITYTVDTDCYASLSGGNYRIILSSGYVQFNGDKENVNAEEYVLNFSIKGEPAPVEVDAAFTADPENNATVTEIKEIVLTFTDYSSVEVAAMDFVTGANIPTVYMVDDLTGSTMPGGYIMFDAGNGTNTLRLYVDPQYAGVESFTAEGSYVIRIPAGVVTFADGINKEILLNYTVKAAVAEDPVATWSIEEGATIESFESVSVTFAGVDSAKSYSMYPAVFYSVAEDGTTALVENYCTAGVLDASASGTTITYTVDTDCYASLSGGNYRIILSPGYVQFNGDKENVNAEEYVLNFTLNAPTAPTQVDAAFTADPANNTTVAEIKEIVLTFTDYSEVTVAAPDLMTGANIPTVNMVDDLTGSTMPAGYIMFDAGSGANTLRLYVDPQYAGVESFTAEGSYVIRIPAGVVTFADGINKEILLNYTVKAGGDEPAKGVPTGFIPEAGTEISSISDVVVKFNTADYDNCDIEPDWWSLVEKPTVYNEAGEVVETTASYSYYGEDYTVGYVKFNPAITEPGTYTIKFAEGTFCALNEDFSPKSPAFEVTYTVSASVVNTNPGPISVTPENGSTVEKLDVVYMTFSAEDYPSEMETNTSTPVSVTDATGTQVTTAKVQVDPYGEDELTVRCTLYEEITADGVYTITIPEGHIWEYGNKASKTVPEIKLTYTIGTSSSEREGFARIEPAEGSSVESLQVFKIWVTEAYADRNTSCTELATIVDAEGNVVSQANADENVEYSFEDDYLLTITFQTEVTTPGEYTVKFPEAFMCYAFQDSDNKKYMGAMEFKYTVTGKSVSDKEGTVAATSVSPEAGDVTSISEFILTYDATGIALAPENEDGTNVVMLRKNDGDMASVIALTASLVEGADNQLKLTVDGDAITTPGTYELYVGEGVVNFEGSSKYVNEEAIYTYNIVQEGLGGKLSSVFPPQGEIDLASIGARFRGISMTFAEEVTMVADELLPSDKITITYKGEVAEEISLEKLALDIMDETNMKVDLVFENSYSEGGDYVITIPAGWATFADGSTVEEIVLNYTIPTVAYSNAYTVTPEAGSELDSITVLVLDFYENEFAGKNSKCLVPSYQWYGKTYVIDDAGNKVTECFIYKEEGETLIGIELNDPIVTPGDYTVVIPQGQITFVQNSNPTEDEVNKEIRINYTVKGDAPKTFEYTVDPAAGPVESLSTISVTFTGATALEFQESGVYASLYKVTAEGDEFYRAGNYTVNGNVFTFTANAGEDDEPNITEIGKYAFIMPEGFIKVDGTYSKEIRVEYQIGEPAAIEIVSPKPGSFLTNLSEFTVMAAGATTLEENETRSKIQIAKGDESVCIVSVLSQEGNTVVLKAATKIVEAGEYTLIIPKGYFLIDGVMTEEEYSYTYYVSGEDDKEFKLPTMDPEEGLVEDFSMFTMTWEDATSVTTENAVMTGTSGIALYSIVGETETKVVDYIGMTAGDNAIMLNAMTAVTAEAGEYKLVVPAGLITVDGVVNEYMEFFYQYLPPVEFELTFSTAEDGVVSDGGSVHSVAEFTITFDPCEESLALNPDCTGNIALWTAGYPETMIGYFEVAIEGLTAKLSLTVKADEVEDGKYTILIPEDFFLVDGELCGGQSFALDLTKSGIYGIEADARELNVYNMDGILVLRNAKAADLKTLQKGIYIVNGKKILVR